MANIGYGYGSECHLLRWMGRHRQLFESKITEAIDPIKGRVEFLDFKFKAGEVWPDAEWKGIDFIPPNHPVHAAWHGYWPQTGNVPNWDAIGKIVCISDEEWLLVEAKAHTEELESKCGAKEHGGLPKIREAFQTTIEQLSIKMDVSSWLEPYYQYANRFAVLSFLHSQNIKARLLNIYFVGDINRKGWTSPQSTEEWHPHLVNLESHLGLSSGHKLAPFVHKLFLNIADPEM